MSRADLPKEIAVVLAKPGPIQREARNQVQKNNRRRFGP
jgi:hypothetical protein